METLTIILQVTGITSGRAAALLPAAIGLIGTMIAWAVLRRSRSQKSQGRVGAIVAISLGLVGLILSVLHLIRTAESTIGTGSGRLGAIVAIILALLSITLGGVGLLRSGKLFRS